MYCTVSELAKIRTVVVSIFVLVRQKEDLSLSEVEFDLSIH